MPNDDWIENYGKNKEWAQRRTALTNSLTVSARTGAREMVAAVRWLEQQGLSPKSRSDIVGMCVKAIASLTPQEEWPSTAEVAHSFLDTHFGVLTTVRGHRIRSSRIADPEERAKAYDSIRALNQSEGIHLPNPSQPPQGGNGYFDDHVEDRPIVTDYQGKVYFICKDSRVKRIFLETKQDIITQCNGEVVTASEWVSLSEPTQP